MVFSDRPVASLEELYGKGHRDAVRRLHDAVERGYFTVVLGARRVGKTSVVKTLLKHYGYKYLYFDASPYMGLRAVSLRSLVPAEVGFDEEALSGEARLNLALISLKLKKIRLTSDVFQSSFLTLLRELNSRYDRFVLVFDEAQVMAFVKGVNYRGLLQFVHNNYRNVVVILTGSMPGLLEKIISPTDAREPGFARYVEEIQVPRWSREETIGFLKSGFKENNVAYEEEELHEVHEELSGIPGFITHYGLLRVRGTSHPEALAKTEEYAIAQWENDLQAFLRIYNSPHYLHVLGILSETLTGATWAELQRELERTTGRPPGKSTLHRILTNLLKAGMIEKQRGKYTIADRPLRKTIGKLRKNHPTKHP